MTVLWKKSITTNEIQVAQYEIWDPYEVLYRLINKLMHYPAAEGSGQKTKKLEIKLVKEKSIIILACEVT